MAEEPARTWEGGYDGVKGFWLNVYGVTVCDSSRMCLVVGYLGCMCVGFYCWHVVTTGSFMLSTKGSVVDYLAGGDDDSDARTPATRARKATPSIAARKGAGKRVTSVGLSDGEKPVDRDDEWVKME